MVRRRRTVFRILSALVVAMTFLPLLKPMNLTSFLAEAEVKDEDMRQRQPTVSDTVTVTKSNPQKVGSRNLKPRKNGQKSRRARASQPWAAICAVMKDEERYIDEWADYHLALGFAQIHIYDTHPNFTLAEWYQKRQLADPNSNIGIHLTHLPGNVMSDQTKCYDACLQRLRDLPVPPKWVMVMDADEFLVLRKYKKHPSVVDFLKKHLQSGSLRINWIVMGSANETTYRPEPVTKRFQYACCPTMSDITKSVAILDHVEGWESPHATILKPGYGDIGVGGRKVSKHGNNRLVPGGDLSVAALYHYKYKSAEEFTYKSCDRGQAWGPDGFYKCPVTPETGFKFDDRAWEALKRLVPKYATLRQ
jgi:hypothetical protein